MKRFALIITCMALFVTVFGQREFRVMSYNIRNSYANDGENSWNKRREATVRMLTESKPMVVGMQEVCPEQKTYLESALSGYRHIGVGRDNGKDEGEIMSVFYDTTLVKVEMWGTFWLSETPEEPSLGWDAACRRTCTWAVMTDKSSGERFLMYNTHLDHVGKVARKMEVRLIADSVKAMTKRLKIGRVFMTGDFNTTAANKIFKPLKKVMKEAREVCPMSDKGYTYNGFGKVNPNAGNVLDSNGNTDNEVAIDHIFYKGAKGERFEVLRGDYGVPFVSDHFPVVCIFTF